MAGRSTRNKIRHQADQAWEHLAKAQLNMTQIAALADDRSEVINESVPPIIAAMETIITTWDKLREVL